MDSSYFRIELVVVIDVIIELNRDNKASKEQSMDETE
jgi:hypothetical protein